MMGKKKKISLLGPENPAGYFWERLTNWMTGPGRFMVLITELVVFSAFISRFWLDARNNDLTEMLQEKQAVIDSTRQFRQEYLQVANWLETIAATLKQRKNPAQPLTILEDDLPANLRVTSVQVVPAATNGQRRMDFVLDVNSEGELASFINKLSRDRRVKSIDVGRGERDSLQAGTRLHISVLLAN